MEREREGIRRREKEIEDQSNEATSPPGRGGHVGLSGAESPLAVRPTASLTASSPSHVLPQFFSPYLGHPNSDF